MIIDAATMPRPYTAPPAFGTPVKVVRGGSPGRRSGGLAGWAVAVQDPVAVGAGHGHGGVRVEDDLPALAVDHDEVVERAQEGEVDQAGRAAFVAGPDVVRVTACGRLVAAGPAAVPVPQDDQAAQVRRDGVGGLAGVQRE